MAVIIILTTPANDGGPPSDNRPFVAPADAASAMQALRSFGQYHAHDAAYQRDAWAKLSGAIRRARRHTIPGQHPKDAA